MGDSRANIKIEFSIYGKKYKHEMSINYFPENCCGMDKRVTEFFEQSYQDAHAHYKQQDAEYWAERKKQETKEIELKELARLKSKYE